MRTSDARWAVWAAIECGDHSRAATLLVEFEAVYPTAGAALREEVAEAYPDL